MRKKREQIVSVTRCDRVAQLVMHCNAGDCLSDLVLEKIIRLMRVNAKCFLDTVSYQGEAQGSLSVEELREVTVPQVH